MFFIIQSINMKALTISTKYSLILLAVFSLCCTFGCKKSSPSASTPPVNDYGCNSITVLQTMNNTPCQLVYAAAGPFAGDWLIATDLGCSRAYSCVFCDKSVYSAIVAGKSTSTPLNVTVSGTIKRRLQNQEPITQTSGGYETYVVYVTGIQ